MKLSTCKQINMCLCHFRAHALHQKLYGTTLSPHINDIITSPHVHSANILMNVTTGNM